MSLNGVDISGWDVPIDVASLTADFVIAKVTEGLQGDVYNPTWRDMLDEGARSGKLLGTYHYANGDDPIAEADSFYANIKEYKGRIIPCLDWEGQGNDLFGTGEDVTWCKRFLDRIASLMGATPLLYTSKAECNAYDWSSVASKYPLWGAEYAYDDYTYDGYEDEPWQSRHPWGAWGVIPKIHQYGYVNPQPNNGGQSRLDADKFYGTREDWLRMCGGSKMSIRDRIVAVAREQIGCPYDTRPSFPWDGPASDYDSFNCSGLTRAVYEQCGLTIPSFQNAAKGDSQSRWVMDNGHWCWDVDELERGDLVFWSHTGEWDSTYHVGIYTGNGMCVSANGEAMGVAEHSVWYDSGFVGGGWPLANKPEEEKKVTPKQPSSKTKNDLGLKYRAHVQGAGWLPAVHDGQTAGTEGFGARMEALKVTPPEGMVLDAYAHVQGIGNLYFDGIRAGKSSGTGSSSTDPIIGTVGQARRMEAVMFRVTKWPDKLKGKKLRYQGHVQGVGWDKVCSEGQWCGTRGKGKRLEAVRIWIE